MPKKNAVKKKRSNKRSKTSKKDVQGKYWMFTCNNYDTSMFVDKDGLEYYETLIENDLVEFVAFQEEVGKNQTPHLQGYVCFHRRLRASRVRKLLMGSHVEKRFGTHDEALVYVSKTKTRKKGTQARTYGDDSSVPRKKGQRSDLIQIRDALHKGKTSAELQHEFFPSYIRYRNALLAYEDDLRDKEACVRAKESFEELPAWNHKVIELLKKQRRRQLLWIWDAQGNTGKTRLGRYLKYHMGAFYCTMSKKADIAYAYKREKMVVFDLTRSVKEFVNYDTIESLLSGGIFSGKYDSKFKTFDPPAVLVLSNSLPEKEKLSSDRWVIWNVFDLIKTLGKFSIKAPAPKDIPKPKEVKFRSAKLGKAKAIAKEKKIVIPDDDDSQDDDWFDPSWYDACSSDDNE